VAVSPDTEQLCDCQFVKSHAVVLPILNQKKILYCRTPFLEKKSFLHLIQQQVSAL
jgi:hypothetical protein